MDLSKNHDAKPPADAVQPVCPMLAQPYPYMEEEEIDLLDYARVLWKRKTMVISLVFLTGIFAVVYSLMLPNIYRSEAVIIPRGAEKSGASSALSALGGLAGMAGDILGLGGSGSVEKMETLLKSRVLSRKIYSKYKKEILPELYPDSWDPEKGTWLAEVEKTPTEQDVVKRLLDGLLSVKIDKKKGTLSVAFDHEDPEFAKKMVDRYLEELSETLREETLADARQNQHFLNRQLERTSDVLLKEKIYALLAKEIERETFAKAQSPYSFQILDPPIVPDIDKKIKPKRSQICILSVVVAGFLGVFLAFFLEYIEKQRAKEQTG